MRILLDVSGLGLGHLYRESRSGSFRVHRHLAEELARRGDCELLLCANASSVAYAGCVEYLRSSPVLAHVPLLAPAAAVPRLGRVAAPVHRTVRALLPGRAFPDWLHRAARRVDQRVHPPVGDADPPVDIFHSPVTALPSRPGGRRSPRRLLTIYDAVHAGNAHLHDPGRVEGFRRALASLREDDWVLTTSHATRADLCQGGLFPERVFVTPLAADSATFYPCADAARIQAVRDALGIPPGDYLLALNVMDRRKNMVGTVRAFARLVRQERVPGLSLVLAGPAGAGSPLLAAAVSEAHAAGARIVTTSFVPDEALAPLYSGALAFVYPSLHEGFGLPPLEAMQCGTPVITSNTSSLPEVVGNAAVMVDPLNEDALCQAMLDVVHDTALRRRLRGLSLQRAATFSWTRFAEETLGAYRAVLAA